MDPFRMTLGPLDISGFGLPIVSELRDVINGLTEAKEVVQGIALDLDAIQQPPNALEELKLSNSTMHAIASKPLEKTGIAEAINCCGQKDTDFGKNLTLWTKHSLEENYIIQLRSEHTSQTAREKLKQQLQALEKAIQDHFEFTKRQQDEIQKRMNEQDEEPEDEENGGAQRALPLNEVEKQSRLLGGDQTSPRVVFSQSQSERTSQVIGNVITSDGSRALVGLPLSVVRKIDQRIEGVTTQHKSAAIVGVFSDDVDMKSFFNKAASQ
ncbi:hypothetical protein MMC25_006669 [Agyrium rufum]|nr:hypothetical protein [Agyrium rufum]